MSKNPVGPVDANQKDSSPLKEDHSVPVIKAAPVYSNNDYGLKKARSIAVDDTTHLLHNHLQESTSKFYNAEPSKSTVASISLPTLQSSINNKRYERINILF